MLLFHSITCRWFLLFLMAILMKIYKIGFLIFISSIELKETVHSAIVMYDWIYAYDVLWYFVELLKKIQYPYRIIITTNISKLVGSYDFEIF